MVHVDPERIVQNVLVDVEALAHEIKSEGRSALSVPVRGQSPTPAPPIFIL